MKLFGSPIVIPMALGLLVAGFVCLLGILLVRRLRRTFTEAGQIDDGHPEPDQFPLHTYHAVIQQLKQQKHELQSTQQAERRRAKTSESISAAVLSHLSCGVMFFTPSGLVRQANVAAKNILGFASPIGMSTAEIFRNSTVISDALQPGLAATVEASLQEKVRIHALHAQYVTPAGDQRILEITLTPVLAPSGDILGAACVINDQTALEQLQRREELRGEISAEMALTLRTSLATISGYAQQVATDGDPQRVKQLAADIISEAMQLDHTLGGFLAGAKAAKAAGA